MIKKFIFMAQRLKKINKYSKSSLGVMKRRSTMSLHNLWKEAVKKTYFAQSSPSPLIKF